MLLSGGLRAVASARLRAAGSSVGSGGFSGSAAYQEGRVVERRAKGRSEWALEKEAEGEGSVAGLPPDATALGHALDLRRVEWYQTYRSRSLGIWGMVLVIYFGFLREGVDDADWDLLDRPVYKKVPYLEKERLEALKSVAKAKGDPLDEYDIRLAQVNACIDARDRNALRNPTPDMVPFLVYKDL